MESRNSVNSHKTQEMYNSNSLHSLSRPHSSISKIEPFSNTLSASNSSSCLKPKLQPGAKAKLSLSASGSMKKILGPERIIIKKKNRSLSASKKEDHTASKDQLEKGRTHSLKVAIKIKPSSPTLQEGHKTVTRIKQSKSSKISSLNVKPPLPSLSGLVSPTFNVSGNPIPAVQSKEFKISKHNSRNISATANKSKQSLSFIVNELDKLNKTAKLEESKFKKSKKLTDDQKILHTNFNLSFNNSFNTSVGGNSTITNTNQTLPSVDLKKVNRGADALQMEILLTNRLREVDKERGMTDKKFAVFAKIFEDVIEKDKNFGGLLLKIKNAYDEYLRRTVANSTEKFEFDSMKTRKDADIAEKYMDLSNKYEKQKEELEKIKKDYSEKEKIVRQELNLKLLYIQDLESSLKNLQSQIEGSKKLTPRKLLKDIKILKAQNFELTTTAGQYKSNLEYLHHRENKLMFLLFTLENKGFPVKQIFESEIKSIPTYRFADDNNYFQQHLNEEDNSFNKVNTSIERSFAGDVSFDPIKFSSRGVSVKPDTVPSLDFNGLPEYESSSDEEDQQIQQNMMAYATSSDLKYVHEFYKKNYSSSKDLSISASVIDQKESTKNLMYRNDSMANIAQQTSLINSRKMSQNEDNSVILFDTNESKVENK